MTIVTVVREVPPPVIGMIGVVPDPRFQAFERTLDWLETTGVPVERLDPGTGAEEGVRAPGLPHHPGGKGALPVVLVDGVVVSTGVYLTRAELARAGGRARREPSVA